MVTEARLERAARLRPGYFYFTGRAAGEQRAPQEAKHQADLGFFGPNVNSEQHQQERRPRSCTGRLPGGAAGIQDYGVEAGGSALEGPRLALGQLRPQGNPADQARRYDGHDAYLDDYAGQAEHPADRLQQRDRLLTSAAESRSSGGRPAPRGRRRPRWTRRARRPSGRESGLARSSPPNFIADGVLRLHARAGSASRRREAC